jgi:hypothetical protein
MSHHTVVAILITALLAVAPVAAPQAAVVPGDQRVDHVRDAVEFHRQTMTVWFYKPIKVGDRILSGKYIIEHDNVRMSRGLPCTYLYAASDPRLPVVSFRCRHLTRPETAAPTVIVRSFHVANGMTELVAFQFAGETLVHGVPDAR